MASMIRKNAKPKSGSKLLPDSAAFEARGSSNDNDGCDYPRKDESLDKFKKRCVAQLHLKACAIEGTTISNADYYALNGEGPNEFLHDTLWNIPGMTERQKDKLRAQQNRTYHGLAPNDAMECMRGRCMVMLESAATGALTKVAMVDDLAVQQAYLTMALRSLEGLNKMSERFERARGQAQQQIVVQHNRFDSGSPPVLQTVQADKIENHAGSTPLLGQTIDPLEVATVTAKSPNKKRARRQATKAS